MNRRGFLGACLAAFAAPAIVRAESLMRLAEPTFGYAEATYTIYTHPVPEVVGGDILEGDGLLEILETRVRMFGTGFIVMTANEIWGEGGNVIAVVRDPMVDPMRVLLRPRETDFNFFKAPE